MQDNKLYTINASYCDGCVKKKAIGELKKYKIKKKIICIVKKKLITRSTTTLMYYNNII